MHKEPAVIGPLPYGENKVRRHPRLLFSVPITLRHLTTRGIRSSHGISLDISQSGIGALIEGGLEEGDTVEIDLQLPQQRLTAVAIVRHTSHIRSGFEFVGLTMEERSYLSTMVANA
jgi:hypothetical protein